MTARLLPWPAGFRIRLQTWVRCNGRKGPGCRGPRAAPTKASSTAGSVGVGSIGVLGMLALGAWAMQSSADDVGWRVRVNVQEGRVDVSLHPLECVMLIEVMLARVRPCQDLTSPDDSEPRSQHYWGGVCVQGQRRRGKQHDDGLLNDILLITASSTTATGAAAATAGAVLGPLFAAAVAAGLGLL
ncbi:hypothetical protein DCS_03250 [Drechmeria coniospora]|uniref:Uncharacterized protein n=1 Tax=Drechmeria coniospora TaxID=98403 RepID=A0A151GYD1_DRECN|nr:hypothetical protein DCS_03250 [Drechmeria coniospora]KYK62104.1 hypothetical protein DCS_03250 [Drechmeria coniospora]